MMFVRHLRYGEMFEERLACRARSFSELIRKYTVDHDWSEQARLGKTRAAPRQQLNTLGHRDTMRRLVACFDAAL